MLPPAVAEALVLFEIGALLLGLAGLAWLGGRLRVSAIPLYLLGGLVLGAGEPIAISEDVIELGAATGIVLLLFMLGLEYTAQELRTNLRLNFRGGVLDGALNFTLGLVAGLLLGWSFTAAFLLGGATYISSSGVIAKVLDDLDRLANRETPTVLSLLVIEDLVMAAYLPVASVLIAGGALAEAAGRIAVALGAVGLILLVALRYGHRLSRPLHNVSNEVLLLAVFGAMMLVAGIAEQAQVSSAVGAFLVGIAVSGPVAERARLQLAPLRDLFAAVFFVFFGLSIDTGSLPAVAIPALVLALATIVTKLFTGYWAARRAGAGRLGAERAGTVFIAHGEFSIVIAGLGVAAGVEPELGPLVAAYVLVTATVGAISTRFAGAVRGRTADAPSPGGAG